MEEFPLLSGCLYKATTRFFFSSSDKVSGLKTTNQPFLVLYVKQSGSSFTHYILTSQGEVRWFILDKNYKSKNIEKVY